MAVGLQSSAVYPKPEVSLQAQRIISPYALQSLEVLSLPVAALEGYINRVLETNPFFGVYSFGGLRPYRGNRIRHTRRGR
jgi:hypothetical protein